MFTHSTPSFPAIVARAALFGVAAGLRSMTPNGVLASERNDSSVHGRWKTWPVLRSNRGRIALQLAWIGELVGDKLPGVPPRTNPGPLAGRTLFGALAGAAIGTQREGASSMIASVLAGAAGGFAGSHAGYLYRSRLAAKTGLPDLPLALAEDVAAWAIAEKALRG